MKRGKEDEKIMGPMFPRLHVNDTEKGGPRAPPRNKMALYEQLTIPSQRYVAPPEQNNNSKPVPPTSTSQGPSNERNTYFPRNRPPSAPSYDAVQAPEASNSNNQLVREENKKKPLQEDDFMVPVFSEIRTEMHDKSRNSIDGGGQIHLSLSNRGLLPTTVGGGTNEGNYGLLVSKQQFKGQDGSTLRVSASTRSSLDVSMGGRDDMPWQNDASLQREHQEKREFRSIGDTGLCLMEDHENSLPAEDAAIDEDVMDLQRQDPCDHTPLRLRVNFRTDNSEIDLEKENIDRGDDVSENSMVDSASEFDVTPDDVVDIIGRNQFWKARTAIVNQQRVFAIQVFELHRLLKVQKHFAGSPNLLLEASAIVAQATLKPLATKKLSPEYVVKVLPLKGTQQKDATHRATDDVEGTAENAVPKATAPALVLSQQHPIQPKDYTSFSSNTGLPPPGNMDSKTNPWGFHQLSAHQWLVPVMTPSEGLVYKPYPAPGFSGPICGGCGPTGNFMNPPYQQGVGMPPGMHFGGHGYFPPYGGMPMMNSCVSGSTMDQFTPFPGPNAYNQSGESRGAEHKRLRTQGSTASSPSERATGTKTLPPCEGQDANRLSAPPPTTEAPIDTPPKEKQARVIRAVPQRSTSDSAARLFKSIQLERQLHESS